MNVTNRLFYNKFWFAQTDTGGCCCFVYVDSFVETVLLSTTTLRLMRHQIALTPDNKSQSSVVVRWKFHGIYLFCRVFLLVETQFSVSIARSPVDL